MNSPAPRFAMLAELSRETSSEGRRDILRKVTQTLGRGGSGENLAEFDTLLAAVASDYSAQVRADLSRLIADNDAQFACSAQLFALDDIEIAEPILKRSRNLTDETLLKVIAQKSQAHMMAVTGRQEISERISGALVERGSDEVVSALLANEKARIGADTYEAVSERAQTSTMLQAPLVRRKDIPLDLLNELYLRVETGLRKEILGKFSHVSSEEMESAFKRGRSRLSSTYGNAPDDMPAARQRINLLTRQGQLTPSVLIGLLREGAAARTAFMLAFATLADVEFGLIQRTIEGGDLDTLALLCRGANFERALFVALAIALDGQDRGMGGADAFGKLYESVPVTAAQRALRFWKVRDAA